MDHYAYFHPRLNFEKFKIRTRILRTLRIRHGKHRLCGCIFRPITDRMDRYVRAIRSIHRICIRVREWGQPHLSPNISMYPYLLLIIRKLIKKTNHANFFCVDYCGFYPQLSALSVMCVCVTGALLFNVFCVLCIIYYIQGKMKRNIKEKRKYRK